MTPIDRAVELLRTARRVTALTGAGVSAASGIPTFRGAGGLWRNFRPETLATPQAFNRDPTLVWEWYDWRRSLIRAAEPNAAHHVLARWAREWPEFTLITQNVDGLHERAGADDLIRLHGSIWHVRCTAECAGGATEWLADDVPLGTLPPRCPHCNALARPAVVWFGEPLDPLIVERATAATVCDVFLTIGTSAVVYPAAGLVHQARGLAAKTIEINLDETEASGTVDVTIRGKAEEVLDEIARRLSSVSRKP